MSSYHVLELVGEGSFGRVHKGRKKGTGLVVALKFMPKVSKKELRNLKREIEIMRRLKHPNIVQLLDSFETENEVVVVTEYAEGQLFRILEDDGKLPENQIREIACQLVSALYYLHSHRIIHRDMKPQNILLGKSGIVKLCDFGFARAMSVATLVLTSIKGTPLYMSPELVEEKPYDHTADLWSLGCILYEIHTGAPPFYTNSIFHLVKLIVQARVKWPDTMSSTFVDFLKGLLTKEPEKRLNWPDLLHHPFVAEGVFVLPDPGVSSPLTVAPSADLQQQKLKQFAEKLIPTSGQSRLLRKVMQQKDSRRNQRKPIGTDGSPKNNNLSGNKGPNSGTVPPSGINPNPSPNDVSVHPGHKANEMFTSPVQEHTSAHSRTHKSKDYDQRFSKGEIKSQLLGWHTDDSLTMLQRKDFDNEERPTLSQASDKSRKQNQTTNHTDITSHLEPKILEFKAELTSGCVEDVQIHHALKLLRDLLTTSPETMEHVVQKLGLPHVVFDLISISVENSDFFKQPWFVPVLEEMLMVLTIHLERHEDWVEDEQGLEDLSQPFSLILTDPDLRPLAPLAARVLSLFSKCGLDVQVNMDNLTSLLNDLATDLCKLKTSLPADWGLCDGPLSLLFTMTEHDNFSMSSSLTPALLLSLWKKIGTSRTTTKLNLHFCSLHGLYSFLSIVLHVFTMDPYSCLLFVTDDESKCVSTLGWLVGTDCLDLFAAPVTSEVHRLHHNLSTLSCHLLCFPFALDLPSRTMSTVLRVYDSCGIVTHLLQVILTSVYSMLELPLALLCRLLLCDPENSFHHLRKAAFSFFSPPSDSQPTASTRQTPARSASSLLADLLQLDTLWDSAVELLNVLSHVARCSSSSSCFQLYVEATVLHQALTHSYDLIRAATCRLLGYLDPFRPPSLFVLQVDIFRDLIQCLHDPYMPARRTACRSVVNWLGYIAAGCKLDQSDGRCSEPTSKEHNKVEGLEIAESRHLTTRPRLRVDTDEGRTWVKEVRETVPILTCLITDADVLMRRHCCAALGNLADVDGGNRLLLDHDVPSVLLRAACTDSEDAVRKAAAATLCLYTQHDALREALLSLDAKKKLQASQKAVSQSHYQQLIGLL